jgi:hypothetical protein
MRTPFFVSIFGISNFSPGTAKYSFQTSFNNFIKLTYGQTELLKNYITFKI